MKLGMFRWFLACSWLTDFGDEDDGDNIDDGDDDDEVTHIKHNTLLQTDWE